MTGIKEKQGKASQGLENNFTLITHFLQRRVAIMTTSSSHVMTQTTERGKSKQENGILEPGDRQRRNRIFFTQNFDSNNEVFFYILSHVCNRYLLARVIFLGGRGKVVWTQGSGKEGLKFLRSPILSTRRGGGGGNLSLEGEVFLSFFFSFYLFLFFKKERARIRVFSFGCRSPDIPFSTFFFYLREREKGEK